MILLEDKDNVTAPDATFPYGDVKDDTGSDDGTRYNRVSQSDYFQFFAKMFAESGLTANGLLDNEVNGWQLYEALKRASKPYDVYTAIMSQSGTGAPTVTVLTNELSGAIVWGYSSTGTYTGTLVGAFPSGLVWTMCSTTGSSENTQINRVTDDGISVIHRDASGTLNDDFTDLFLEIRVYRS